MAGSRSVCVRAVFAQAQISIPGSFAVSPSGAANYTISIQVPPLTPHSALADLVPPHSGIARAAVLSRATMRNIRQQIAFACRYNSLRHNRDRS